MTVTLTEADKKRILENFTIEDCENIIKELMDEVEEVRQNDPEDLFVIEAINIGRIEYYKLAIKLLEEAEEAEKINFDTTEEEDDLILEIVKRIDSYVPVRDVKGRMMDIIACHCNGCRLDLKKLLNLDRASFLHDVVGIATCLDRTTGKIRNGFRPRSAI